jgi:hypothetical protein
MHQVQLSQQLIAQLIASSMSSASTADNGSTSGSSGKLSQTTERPSFHESLLTKEMLTKIKDAVKVSTEDLVEKYKNSLCGTTRPAKIQIVFCALVVSTKSAVPPNGGRLAAILTVAADLPNAWLLEASVGRLDTDLFGEAVKCLQSMVTPLPAGTARAVHPFTERQRAQREQYKVALDMDPVLSAIDGELRTVLLRVLAPELRNVTAVATASNCVNLIYNVLQTVNYHEIDQFTDQRVVVNKQPPPFKPAPPYPVQAALELLLQWYKYRVQTVTNELAMSVEDHQLSLCIKAMPTGDGQIGRKLENIQSTLRAQLFNPVGGVRGHEANVQLIEDLIEEHRNRQYTGALFPASDGGSGATALLGATSNPWQRPPSPPAKAAAKAAATAAALAASGVAADSAPTSHGGKSESADAFWRHRCVWL